MRTLVELKAYFASAEANKNLWEMGDAFDDAIRQMVAALADKEKAERALEHSEAHAAELTSLGVEASALCDKGVEIKDEYKARALKAEAILVELERIGTEPPQHTFSGAVKPGDSRGRIMRILEAIAEARSKVEQEQKGGG